MTQETSRAIKYATGASGLINNYFERVSAEIASAKTTPRAERIWAEAAREAKEWAASQH